MRFKERVRNVVRGVNNLSGDSESRVDTNDAQEQETVEQETRSTETQLSNAVQYYQWYEADPERLEAEKQAMQQKEFEAKVYPDSRIVFTGQVLGNEVLVILDYLYPLKPPSVYLLTENVSIPEKMVNEDGSIDLGGTKPWDANTMMADTVIDLLEQLLSFCGTKNVKPDNKGEI